MPLRSSRGAASRRDGIMTQSRLHELCGTCTAWAVANRGFAAYLTASAALLVLLVVDAAFRGPSGLLFPLSRFAGRDLSHGTGAALDSAACFWLQVAPLQKNW